MKKRFLLTSLFMMLFTFVAFASSTYAWFSMNTVNKLNEFTLGSANATGGLEISNDGITFSKTEVEFTSPSSFASLDITTADGVKFYKADAVNAAGQPTSLSETTSAGSDWYEFDLYFRTKVAGSVYIDFANSYIVPESLKPSYANNTYTWKHTLGGTQNVTTSSLPKAYNDATGVSEADQRLSSSSGTSKFTTDWIAAAMRMSYQVTGYQNNMASTYDTSKATAYTGTSAKTAYIFEPLSGFKLNSSNLGTYSIGAEAGVDSGIQKVSGDGSAATPYALEGGARNDNEWSTPSGHSLTPAAMYQVSDTDHETSQKKESNTKLEYNASTDADKYQITKVTFRIWVEGQDNAALNALSGGKYAIALSFKLDSFGVAKSTITVDNPNALIKKTEGTEQMYIDWSAYAAGVSKLTLVKRVANTGADAATKPYIYTEKELNSTTANNFIFDTAFSYDANAEYMIVPTLMNDNDTAIYKLGTGHDNTWETTGYTTVKKYDGFHIQHLITVADPVAKIEGDDTSKSIKWTAFGNAVDTVTIVKRVANTGADAATKPYIYTTQLVSNPATANEVALSGTIAYEDGAQYMIVANKIDDTNNAKYVFDSTRVTSGWVNDSTNYQGWLVAAYVAPAA